MYLIFGPCPNADTWAISFLYPDGRLRFKLLAPTRSTKLTVVVSIMVFLDVCVEVWFMLWPLLIFLIVAGDLTLRTLEKESLPPDPPVWHSGGGLPFGPSAALGRSPPLPVLNWVAAGQPNCECRWVPWGRGIQVESSPSLGGGGLFSRCPQDHSLTHGIGECKGQSLSRPLSKTLREWLHCGLLIDTAHWGLVG